MKFYGILPYVLLEDSFDVGGVHFRSHHKEKTSPWSEEDTSKFIELNRLFADERNGRSKISTWFLIEAEEVPPSFQLAYHRLISAVQFAILDEGGLREQPAAETVDAWLFAEETNVPDTDFHFWQTVGPFSRSMHVSGGSTTFHPRAPHIRFDFARGRDRILETASGLAGDEFAALGEGAWPTLDSLPFFLDGCRSPDVSDIRISLVSLVTAFEVLFEITVRRGKGVKLANHIEQLLRPSFGKWAPTDAKQMFKNLRKFVEDMYGARSDILHEGETDSAKLLFLSKKSTNPFVGFLWKGRQLFVACLRARLDILDHVELALILKDLVSNEDRLHRIVEGLGTGDLDRAKEALHLCSELQAYPSPESNQLVIEAWAELVGFAKRLGFRASCRCHLRFPLTRVFQHNRHRVGRSNGLLPGHTKFP